MKFQVNKQICPQLNQKKPSIKRNSQYTFNMLAKNFINYFDDSFDNESNGNKAFNNAGSRKQQELNIPSRGSSKKGLNKFAELTPLAQKQTKIVYSNISNDEQNESFSTNSQSNKVTIAQLNSTQIVQKEQLSNFQQLQSRGEKYKKEGQLRRPSNPFILQINYEENSEDSSVQEIELPVDKAKNHFVFQLSEEIAKCKKVQKIYHKIGYFHSDGAQCKNELAQQIQKNTILQLVLDRNKQGFNMFWPEFYLHFEDQQQILMAAKKVSSTLLTYIISSNSSNFQENSESYLGKIKSNLFGDIINVFGLGLNPSNAKEASKVPRQLLATIVYSKISSDKPREFEVFIKKPEYKYYLNFQQVIMYEEEIPLSQLYKFPQNRSKITRCWNRKPTYRPQDQCFKLNFHGKAQRSSIKNFILEKDGEEVMLFAKADDNKFNMEISYPFSTFVGMAIALTAFDSKLFIGQ